MPIEKTESGSIVVTGKKAIEFASWLSLRGAVNLESKGFFRSRRPSAATIAKQRLNLPKGTKTAKVLEALDVKIEEMKKEQL